jgi:hypothetical protein
MRLTKFHIFVLILLALILCPTFGVCYREGYEMRYPTDNTTFTGSRTFSSYGGKGGYDRAVTKGTTQADYSVQQSPSGNSYTVDQTTYSGGRDKGGVWGWITGIFR